MADVILNINIPDAWVTRVLNAFNAITDTHMTVEARGDEPANEFDGRWDFKIPPKDEVESNKQFGERVLKELGKAIVNMVDIAEDEIRYRTEVQAIVSPLSNVPDNIFT